MFPRVDRNAVPSEGATSGTENGIVTKALANKDNSVLR